ncbi:MAG TPA: AI-2E family transporter [Anaerolineales bacterium]
MSEQTPANPSPNWGSLTKLVVGLTFIAIIAALLVQFRSIVGPILLAFILAYLLYPVAAMLSKVSRLSWRASVNLIFLLVVVIYLGLITLTGFTVVQQLQSLIDFVRRAVTDLPSLAERLSTQVYQFGPWQFSTGQLDLEALSRELLSTLQPLLGRMGSLISTFATSAAATLGWSFFVLIIAYFLLADTGQFPNQLLHIGIPGYDDDISHLGIELRKIWNAYLRGQLIVILLVMISYSILLVILGMRFAFGIAILAGLARFVPYVGPLTTTVVTFLVALFQGENYFGLLPYQYAILVVVASFILDQIYDNLISPRLLGEALGVHPAGVLIVAIIAANLIGLIGLVLAAPVLATLRLISRYVGRKMFDLNPWPETEPPPPTSPLDVPWSRWIRRLRAWARSLKLK